MVTSVYTGLMFDQPYFYTLAQCTEPPGNKRRCTTRAWLKNTIGPSSTYILPKWTIFKHYSFFPVILKIPRVSRNAVVQLRRVFGISTGNLTWIENVLPCFRSNILLRVWPEWSCFFVFSMCVSESIRLRILNSFSLVCVFRMKKIRALFTRLFRLIGPTEN